MKRLNLGICIGLLLCLSGFSSAFGSITGPHGELAKYMANTSNKGVCANCHIPHYAKGKKIWARDLSGQAFGGVRQLCYSCHDGTFSGGTSVFGNIYETHVMHGAANVFDSDIVTDDYDENIFPLDPNDEDKNADTGHPEEWDKGGNGFYCGSCHNPHIEPESDPNGDYLRSMPNEVVGKAGNRTPFCNQCHTPSIKPHFTSSNCEACHHPHEGIMRAKKGQDPDTIRNNKAARLIFKADVFVGAAFKARPNVSEINDPEEPFISKDPFVVNPVFIDSSFFCYGCHRPHHLESSEDYNVWREAGAAPVYGDNDPNFLEHHPMGAEALSSGDHYSPQVSAVVNFNSQNQLTCTSCHVNHIVEETSGYEDKVNNFLRNFEGKIDGFTDDNAKFCLFCHYDKNMSNNSDNSGNSLYFKIDHKHFRGPQDVTSIISPRGKRNVFDPNSSDYVRKIDCLECMFCHFIHDGEERQDNHIQGIGIRADVDALMRVPAVNLDWGDQSEDSDRYDYEDMCYGCHRDSSIVKNGGHNGSLLKWNGDLFTHRFASPPDPNNPPFRIISDEKNAPFPKSDGNGTNIINDYGTRQGYIFCGTCHSVHDNAVSPYLNHEDGDIQISPYKPDSFCEYCHDADSEQLQFVHNSHPINRGPNSPVTVDKWPGLFFSGKSGGDGGITNPLSDEGRIICLTCHNVHAAETSWDGRSKGETAKSDVFHGKLLVMDNFQQKLWPAAGGELCKACHELAGGNDYPEIGGHGNNIAGTITNDYRELSVCANCHVPHYSLGPKLWSREGYDSGPFGGYRQLCYTCHNPYLDIATTGLETVFKARGGVVDLTDPNLPMDHVMHAAANISNLSVTDFPVDPNDWDTFPPGPEEYREGGSFYCGSCHNPHDQPRDNVNIKDKYLRASLEDSGEVFCRVCHQDAHASTCLDKCHKVHIGAVLPDENETEARWILSQKVIRNRFIAYPNVPSLSEDPNDFSKTDSPFCYGCHGPVSSQYWEIPAIYGDDAVESGKESKEHHPMGTQAWLGDSLKVKNNVFIRAEGTPLEFLNPNQQVTCKSCHDEVHGKGEFEEYDDAKANYFLRWKLNDGQSKDRLDFCIECHVNKETLSTDPNENHYRISADLSPNKRGGCMFCHFIHDGEERQANNIQGIGIRADVDALMREPAVNLAWGDQSGDSDRYDYEDMCYGCHSKGSIVKGSCNDGALLKWSADLYTHRFASAPDPNNAPYWAISDRENAAFPKSDGNGTNILNDYGTHQGHIFCGTCHRVHDNTVSPFLNHEDGDTQISPYEPAGFCEYCHDADSGQFRFVHDSHPVSDFGNDYNPNPPATVDKWPDLFFSGISGCKNGVTYPPSDDGSIICLTCHNVHAAATSWKGDITSDPGNDIHGKLLVTDNFPSDSDQGSDMCQECHAF